MGNRPIQVVKPVSQINALPYVPLCDCPPVLGAFFDPEQGASSGIIVVTRLGVENFSPKTGSRRYGTQLLSGEQCITACDFLRASGGTAAGTAGGGGKGGDGKGGGGCGVGRCCVMTGCVDGKIRVYDAVNCKLVGEFGGEGADQTGSAGGTGVVSGNVGSGGGESVSGNAREEDVIKEDEGGSMCTITVVLCPLNNAVVLGFSDGTLRSYFVESGKLAGSYNPPMDLFPQCHVTAVSCVSYFKPKSCIVVGHEASTVNRLSSSSSSTSSSYSHVPSSPIFMYSLQSRKVIRYFLCASSTVTSTHFTEDSKFLVACTHTHIFIWDAVMVAQNQTAALSVSSSAGSSSSASSALTCPGRELYRFALAANLPPVLQCPETKCLSSCMDPREGVVFACFDDAGWLSQVDVGLPNTKLWGIQRSERKAVEGGEEVDNCDNGRSDGGKAVWNRSSEEVWCIPTRLFQARDTNVSDSAGLSERLLRDRNTFEYIGYEARTQTLMIGNRCAEVRLIPDFFGRHQAKQQPAKQLPATSQITAESPQITASADSATAPVRTSNPDVQRVQPGERHEGRRDEPESCPLFSLDPMVHIQKSREQPAEGNR
eukprot:GHVQ01024931.1.p1 GENE.GHVQ01024931.1~~GHVQ01024931.1.p1  ORF type:complete len:599 (+),score=96.67 GHVQ01024931.1:222-2018(+)